MLIVEDALAQLARSRATDAARIDLILSDVAMPRMGGQALFRAMQARGFAEPVVMVTGHPVEPELQALQAEWLSGWMLKPPNLEDLLLMLASICAPRLSTCIM